MSILWHKTSMSSSVATSRISSMKKSPSSSEPICFLLSEHVLGKEKKKVKPIHHLLQFFWLIFLQKLQKSFFGAPKLLLIFVIIFSRLNPGKKKLKRIFVKFKLTKPLVYGNKMGFLVRSQFQQPLFLFSYRNLSTFFCK